MSKYTAKAALREAKNFAKGYTDMQIKVREATSNDPWGPSGAQMAELADATFNTMSFQEIMEMLDKRLNDSGKNWRHVFKALTVLDYLIHSGSDQVVAYAKQNLYVIKTLKEFQYVDEEGKDQGVNVREKSKAIASLLTDEERLKEERRQRQSLRDRMASGSVSAQYGSNIHARSSYQPHGDEDQQLQRAIEESRRTAAEHERRQREKEREDRDLQKALELSKENNRRLSTAQAVNTNSNNQGIDLWGTTDQQKHDLDFFASMSNPAPVAATNQPDPFGIMPPPQQQAPSQNFFNAPSQQSFNAFAAQPAQPVFSNQQQQQQANNPFGAFGDSGNTGVVGFQSAQPQQNAFANNAQSGNFAAFDSAFDNGASQKNFIPKHLQGQNNPAAQLAQIARNATTIDPFANLATNSTPPVNRSSSFGNLNIAPTMSSAVVPQTQNPWGQPQQPNNANFSNMKMLTPVPVSAPAAPAAPVNNSFSAATVPYTGNMIRATAGDPFASLDPFGGAKGGTQASTAPKLAPPMNSNMMGGGMNGGASMNMNGMGNAFSQPMAPSSSGMFQQPQNPQNFGMNGAAGFGQPMQGQRMNNQFMPQQQQPQQQQQQNFFF